MYFSLSTVPQSKPWPPKVPGRTHSHGLGSQRNSRLLQVAALPGSAWPVPKPDNKDTHFYLSSRVVWRHSKFFLVLIVVIKGAALLRTVTIMPINFQYCVHMHTHTRHYFLFFQACFSVVVVFISTDVKLLGSCSESMQKLPCWVSNLC